jgi:hypothetical protein
MLIRLTKSLLFAIVLFAYPCVSQDLLNSHLNDIEWGEGSIMLQDNTELKGLLKFDDKKEIVAFESGNLSKSFTARKVLGFEYFDNRKDVQRVYYSLPYQSEETGAENYGFFEVLRQYPNFTVLIRKTPVTSRKKKNNGGNPNGQPTNAIWNQEAIILEQKEIVFLMDESGLLTSFLEITHKEVEGSLLDRSVEKNKIEDKKLLKKFVGDYYDELLRYSKEMRLQLDDKDDLIKILDYYETLN